MYKNKLTIFIITFSMGGFYACAPKTVPTQSVPATRTVPAASVAPSSETQKKNVPVVRKKDTATTTTTPVVESDKDTFSYQTNAAPAVVAPSKVLVAVDSKGNVLLHDVSAMPGVFDTDSLKALRSYTPSQVKNLAARFNAIPPRALYVPEKLSHKGMRGVYYIYVVRKNKNKLWYWRKSDGFFYLDENYYN